MAGKTFILFLWTPDPTSVSVNAWGVFNQDNTVNRIQNIKYMK